MKRTQENLSGQNGITLIALIITIIVLLILAGISIAMLTGENGILNRAESTSYAQEQGLLLEHMSLAISESIMDRENEHTIVAVLSMAEKNGFISIGSNGTHEIVVLSSSDNDVGEKTALDEISVGATEVKVSKKGTDVSVELKVLGSGNIQVSGADIEVEVGIYIYSETTAIEDSDGNTVLIPGGFGIASESGKNITEGIVIEDEKGNQFVWIPIGEKLIKTNEDGSKEEITNNLGRYSAWGVDTEPLGLDDLISGTNTFSYAESDTGVTNTVATDISGFVSEAESNGGYYIGRFETTSIDEYGKITTKEIEDTLVSVSQPDSATNAKNMYSESEWVESDLMNSVAWDTAVMYIQKFSLIDDAETYATKKGTDTIDKYCNIWNMSVGVQEWTTETGYSSLSNWSCTYRGSRDGATSWETVYRSYNSKTAANTSVGSRPILVSLYK